MPTPRDKELLDRITGAQTTARNNGGGLVTFDDNGMPLPGDAAVPTEQPEQTKPTAPAPAQPVTQQIQQPGFYDWFNEQMKPAVETDEQRRKREKRERTRSLVSSLADFGSAVANLAGTTQYAPNIEPTETMSEKAKARWEKAKAEREANRDWWQNYVLRQAQMKQADQTQSNWREQFENAKEQAAIEQELTRQKLAQAAERERRYVRDQELQEIRLAIQQGRLNNAQAELEIKRMLAEHKITDDEARRAIDRIKAGGYIQTTTDPNGRETRVVRTPAATGGQRSSGKNGESFYD